jgi:hypothetical protein
MISDRMSGKAIGQLLVVCCPLRERRQRALDSGQRTEDRRQKTDERGQRTEHRGVGGRKWKCGGRKSIGLIAGVKYPIEKIYQLNFFDFRIPPSKCK